MSMALERWLCLGLLGLQIVPYIYSSRSMKSHYSIGHSDHTHEGASSLVLIRPYGHTHEGGA